MLKRLHFFIALSVLAGCTLSGEEHSHVKQTDISHVETMPNHPQPYEMVDWYEKAVNFDKVIFDFTSSGKHKPYIWLDDSKRNFDQQTFGIYTALGDVRQGPKVNNGEFHESLASLGALMGAGLVGIDKTNQDGFNYVKMAQNYFNRDNDWNIIMNNTTPEIAQLGGGYGRDWWYDVFPNVLYYAVSDLFPGVERADELQKTIAEQFYKADSVLDGNYDYSYFDYAEMVGKRNHIPYQQDAAAGHAWLLYAAYQKFGDTRYLEGAQSSLEALLNQDESRYYEVLMPFGAYTAARLNAEEGTNYQYQKILDWTFEGCKADDGRTGWGVISGQWGDYDVHGLQGSREQADAFGFLMNTFSLAWPLVPMVRYDPQYARAVGKWMLNAANASRLCYPYDIPDENQWLPEKKSITRNVIAYEGLRKEDNYGKESLKGISPVALGDGPRWVEGQPPESMFSIYGSGFAGIFGATINKTNVEKILQIDCLATDFYRDEAYPTYLFFNPYQEAKTVNYYTKHNNSVYLYDLITKKIIAEDVKESTDFNIPADGVRILVEIPARHTLERESGRVIAGDVIVSYQ
ncbi:MAG: hypothetical protein ACOCQ6_00485 [Bacteroidota bacterium]